MEIPPDVSKLLLPGLALLATLILAEQIPTSRHFSLTVRMIAFVFSIVAGVVGAIYFSPASASTFFKILLGLLTLLAFFGFYNLVDRLLGIKAKRDNA